MLQEQKQVEGALLLLHLPYSPAFFVGLRFVKSDSACNFAFEFAIHCVAHELRIGLLSTPSLLVLLGATVQWAHRPTVPPPSVQQSGWDGRRRAVLGTGNKFFMPPKLSQKLRSI